MRPPGIENAHEAGLGPLLRRLREARGFTQDDVAALTEPPISVNTISSVERGRSRPYRHTLDGLATALGLDTEQRAELVAAWRALRADETAREPNSASASRQSAATRSASSQDSQLTSLESRASPVGSLLPAPLSSFLGRAQELTEVRQQLATKRLITLTGAGGSGKTRLALEVAAEAGDAFADGVIFVHLAPISDANLVASTIAQLIARPSAQCVFSDSGDSCAPASIA